MPLFLFIIVVIGLGVFTIKQKRKRRERLNEAMKNLLGESETVMNVDLSSKSAAETRDPEKP